MTIDHIGYAVKDIDKAMKSFRTIGYTFENIVDDIDRNIFIAFGTMDGYQIELIAPKKHIGGGITPIDGILSKNGPTPYHICYKSAEIEKDIAMLEENKFKIAIPLAPAIAFEGKRVVFLYSISIGLIEIVET